MAGWAHSSHPPRSGQTTVPAEIEDVTTTDERLQEAGRPNRRARILALCGAVLVLLIGALVILLKVGADGYYVLSPGQAPVVTASAACRAAGGGSFALPGGQPCVQLIVPPGKIHTISGSIMMVDVYQGKPSPWQFLLYKVGLLKRFGNHSVFLPNVAIVGNGSAGQVSCQDNEEAQQAATAAPVAALRQLGYQVQENDLGAQVDTVLPDTSAAQAGIECGDVIVAIDGKDIHTAEEVTSAIDGVPPGTVVHITVKRTGPGGAPKTVPLTATLRPTPATAGRPADTDKGFLGIVSETRVTYDLPFPVSVQVGSIGGPSDGLALALGLIDTLTHGELTGGMQIAATGQIEPDGDVVTIGGAAQKAVAVRKAGAKVFFVPPQNYADAKSTAGPVKVFAVSTLSQALADLESLGGEVPPPAPTTTVPG